MTNKLLTIILILSVIIFVGVSVLVFRINRFCDTRRDITYSISLIDTLYITTYNDKGITATGIMTRYGICAVSPDLLMKGVIRLGDVVIVEGKSYVVMDKTAKRIKNTIDIYTQDYYYKKRLPVYKVNLQ